MGVNSAKSCPPNPLAPCNQSVGCYEAGNAFGYTPGVCQETVVRALFDFCGVCLGNNLDCFFSSVNSAGVAGGIAGGVIAAVVVAAVIAALLIAFFSKKGYDAFQANSARGAGMSNTNPAFQGNEMRGSNPLG